MEITSSKQEMVFRKDYNGKPSYSIGISKKGKDDKFINGYIKANFRKGTEINNKSKILIKNAWLDFYKDGDKTIPTIFVDEFEIVKDSENENEQVEVVDKKSPFEEFGEHITTEFDVGNQIQIDDSDLPF